MRKQATGAVFVAALLLCAPAHAAIVVGADGKPIRRAPGRTVVIGEVRDGVCKVPPSNAVVVFNPASETKLVDVIAWISPVICRPFLVSATTVAEDRRLTIVAPERMTPKEAMRLFLGALDAVGLTVERSGKFLRVLVREPYVTVLVRLKDLPPEEREWLLKEHWGGGGCHGTFSVPETLVITDLRSNLERMLGRPIAR